MRTQAISALALGLAAIAIEPAAARELSGAEIRELIRGRVVRLNTPFGVALPLHYRNDGTVVGDVSRFSAARMLAPKEEGRWWIQGDAMCQQWPSWYNGRRFCFEIRSLAPDKIAWTRDDGAKGTAVIDP
ncbi:hypothetical protein OSH11_09545 [Kaistia dalseonensis]|uniref:Uncharacterized protein n=1 Tax=Kaistia dalseonensis TaxID=410840 RepID=A0ABU0H5E3_9HYPH|nr:hypothetical protein [Kaistia dalseonensis]MCX5494947.1 hypothetical protein [Kaistia dalseonensis]MDQ0437528.1 hypothetical protein [Kaistia dalseonensis]